MQLLRPNDVAQMLNCSVSQVYALKDEGKLRWCKIGGMVRFRPEDVEEFIASCVAVSPRERQKAPSYRLPTPTLKHLTP